MKRIIGKATLAVMGLFAYLILSINFYQNAMADPIGAEKSSDGIGWWYELRNTDEEGRSYVVLTVSTSLMTAVNSRAIADCQMDDGTTDFSCYQTRYSMLVAYVKKYMDAEDGVTNDYAEAAFWAWAKVSEIDESISLPFVIAIYVDRAIKASEKTS